MTRVRFFGKRTLIHVTVVIAALALSSCLLRGPNDLDVSAPKTTLRVGETVQLSVVHGSPGDPRDLTGPASGTTYYTTGESMLIPEADGRVTCIGTNGRERESAVIGATNGARHGSLRFQLLPGGPGPGLDVSADRSVLHESEAVQLHVIKSSFGSAGQELAAATTGTRYLVFAGNAMVDTSVMNVSDSGLASAASSIGRFNYRTVIVFVRNADAVGWIVLKVVPR